MLRFTWLCFQLRLHILYSNRTKFRNQPCIKRYSCVIVIKFDEIFTRYIFFYEIKKLYYEMKKNHYY